MSVRQVLEDVIDEYLHRVLRPDCFSSPAGPQWLTDVSPITGKLSSLDDSESGKHRHLVAEYCTGNGVDLGSSGVPIVPHAIQLDLPIEQYHNYNQDRPAAPIHWRGYATDLPFKDGTLDFVHAAHLLEDYQDWNLLDDPLFEWDRVLKPGGFMLIAVPDHERFRAYVQRHADQGIDVDNLSHKKEHNPGDLTAVLGRAYEVLIDRFVNDDPLEYSWLWVGRKL